MHCGPQVSVQTTDANLGHKQAFDSGSRKSCEPALRMFLGVRSPAKKQLQQIESEWTAGDCPLKMIGSPAGTFLCPGYASINTDVDLGAPG